jgi:Tol biopolymer transport system component
MDIDYIYTKSSEDEEYFRADSVVNAGDIEVSPESEQAWYVSFEGFEGNSSIVLQLSAEGTRQLKLSHFFNPYDIHVNPYDGSLLVVDSRNGRVLHYNNSNRIIGEMVNLSFPVKVLVQ